MLVQLEVRISSGQQLEVETHRIVLSVGVTPSGLSFNPQGYFALEDELRFADLRLNGLMLDSGESTDW